MRPSWRKRHEPCIDTSNDEENSMNEQQNILAEVGQLNMAQLHSMPLNELDRLVQALGQVKHSVHHYEQQVHAAMHARFSERAKTLRDDLGKSTGVVRFDVDGYTVVADLPKRLEYDQQKLKAAVQVLVKWGENPEDYVAMEIKVSEAKFNAWPPAVRTLFEPARTLKPGKPSYKLERLDITQPAANAMAFEEVQ
jgi:hypothetical protein